MKKCLTVRQVCLIIILCFSVSKINVLPAFVSGISYESGFISLIINFVLDYLFLLISIKIISASDGVIGSSDLLITKNKAIDKVFAILFVLFFMLKGIVPILEQKNSIELTYYELQPTLLTFSPFFIVAFYIAYKGLNAFGRSVEIVFVLFIIGITLILLLSVFEGEYSNLLPLIGVPIKTVLKGSYKTLIWFGDPLYLIFFAGKIKLEKGYEKKFKTAYLTSSLIVIAVVVILYAIFYSVAERQYYAPLKISKYAFSLSNIGRLDYFSSLTLALCSVLDMSLPILVSTEIICAVFSVNKKGITALLITFAYFLELVFFKNSFITAIEGISNNLTFVFIIFNYLLPLIYFIFVIKRRKNV